MCGSRTRSKIVRLSYSKLLIQIRRRRSLLSIKKLSLKSLVRIKRDSSVRSIKILRITIRRYGAVTKMQEQEAFLSAVA